MYNCIYLNQYVYLTCMFAACTCVIHSMYITHTPVPFVKETATLHQTIRTLEKDKASAESKVNEMQKKLEDVKNKEMNQLIAEIEDLKSRLEHERAEVGQSCIHYSISGFHIGTSSIYRRGNFC